MNLAIVIAVSEYRPEINNLPACHKDGLAIAEVLKNSGRFDDILRIDGDTNSTPVKSRLTEFVKSHRGTKVDEVFFYFTGHGEFDDNEFFYLLSDYQTHKIRQTSLENSELDNIIRSIQPSLFVKVVDACHSGTTYIKSADEYDAYLKGTKSGFKKLYFMFSSQANQFSYQNEEISYFTESILKAIHSHEASHIRYKDIIDYVSDDFKIRTSQTPLFVTQADFTEIFCDISAIMKEPISKYIQTENEQIEDMKPQKPISILDQLKDDAKRYCSQEEAMAVISSLSSKMRDSLLSLPDADALYQVSITNVEYAPPVPERIGDWIAKYKGDQGYFVDTSYQRESYERPDNSLESLVNPQHRRTITAYRNVVSGFSFTTEMPFNHINAYLTPKLENLTPEACWVVPILSRTHLRLFWAFSHFEYSDWNNARISGKLEWFTDEAALRRRAETEELVEKIVTRFWEFIVTPFPTKFGVSVPAGSDS